MLYVKIGDRYINLNKVAGVEPIFGGMPGTMCVLFVGGDSRELNAEESRALCDYLDRHAADLTPVTK
jgi:hypothetical protein